MKSHSITRRSFVKTSALAAGAIAFPFVSRTNVLGANSKLNLAAIGVGGKGAVDIQCCATENMVALCDVDQVRGAETFEKYPGAKRFKDFRVMFEEIEDEFDAVIISTPDHSHAQPALLAVNAGKHLYVQKPLTHTVYEARILTNMAKARRVVTQMGNQGHCHPDTRRLVELIQAGVLGDVDEVHVWTDRPIWPQGVHAPVDYEPIPETLDWNLWLGPASLRPYSKEYVPFNWRGFWSFGTGSIGDMGCHNMDLAFWSLKLKDPTSIKVLEQDGMTVDSPAKSSITRWEFPKIRWELPEPGKRGSVKLTWYDGGRKPDPKLVNRDELPPNGCIMVGDDDTLFVPMYWGAGEFLSGAKMADFKEVERTLPRFPGADKDTDYAHHQEWIQAVKGNGEAMSNFDFSGPMTEAVLLGNVAMRAGEKIRWNAKMMRITNERAANRYLQTDYRKGFEPPLI
jgi:predicted dehydrogenase